MQYTLLQLNNLVKQAIDDVLPMKYWVEAEISSVNEGRGHLYVDLIEKQDNTNTPIARASAKCWANTWQRLKYDFMSVTNTSLAPGMKVLLEVYAQFHPAYGFSWIITDIDGTYTLGDMARRRQEIICRLKEMGVFDDQRTLSLPIFCQNIAVISSSTAAGYGDFCDQLFNNSYGYKFHIELFCATMQGENVEPSIIEQLNKIYIRQNEFDCVIIIRGGGATSDLSGFDTLNLSMNVAQFPLPIITGIGHERDESILDLVAYRSEKTPTAVAEFLISHLFDVDTHLGDIANTINNIIVQRVDNEHLRLNTIITRLPSILTLLMERQQNRLDLLRQQCMALDPQIVLNRGYSMTLCNGKIITDVSDVNKGEIIETRLSKGSIKSVVK